MSESVFNTQVYASVARKAQAEGIVMLENRDKALPLKKGSRKPPLSSGFLTHLPKSLLYVMT